MRFASELTFTMPREKWMSLLHEDHLAFSSVLALELLSQQGHECIYVAGVNPGDVGDETINGVKWLWRDPGYNVGTLFDSFDPAVVLMNSAPQRALFMTGSRKFKIIQKIHGEAREFLMPSALEMFNICSAVVPTLEYEIEILKASGVKCHMEAIPCGVNFDLVDSCFSSEKEFDIVCSMASRYKGWDLADPVLAELSSMGVSVHPHRNLNGFTRSEYLCQLSRCRYQFHPSGTEGTARTLSEAARLGVIPIVSMDSQNCCQHLDGIPHHEVRTLSWVNWQVGAFCYAADPLIVAKQIKGFIDSYPGAPTTPNFNMPIRFNVTEEAKSLANLMLKVALDR